MRSVLTSLFFTLLLFTSVLFSQTPSTLSLQGVLRDATGAAVADGSYPMTFNLYSTVIGGTALWTETQSTVAVQNGVYSVQLGSVTAFGSLAFNQQYWIGVTAGGSEMSPRITLTAAPYAMGFMGTSNVFGSSGNVGIGTLNPTEKLVVSGAMIVDNATVNGTITAGNANITNLNAGPSTTAALTVNGTAAISADLTLTGTLNSINILNSGAISTGGATLRGNSISASGDVYAGGNLFAGGKPAAVSDARVKIVAGIGTTQVAYGSSTGGFTLSKDGHGAGAGNIKITFEVGYTVVSFNITSAVNAANGNNGDWRLVWWVQYYSGETNAVVAKNKNLSGNATDTEFMFTAILVKN